MKTRTMYMHTLDDQPAAFEHGTYGPHIYFVGGRHKAKLVRTLRQIRNEQKWAMESAAKSEYGTDWADPKHYDYVLVEVPV